MFGSWLDSMIPEESVRMMVNHLSTFGSWIETAYNLTKWWVGFINA